MKHYSQLVDVEDDTFKKRGNKYQKTKVYSNTIYAFDIEVSNLFNIDGEWTVFDKTRSKDFYVDVEKIGIPYIWQFGINDQVYFGRELFDFLKVLKQISNPDITKIIYVHSLSYEFQFLLNILKDYTIDKMCCRDIHKPISFQIKELNIEFRCSYMLTNMKLSTASKEFTDIEKLDTLDYDACVRTPLTKLSQQELLYAEYDILCVYKVVKHFVEIYKNVANIPLTSTSEVRREIRKNVDYFYIMKMQKLVPNMKVYMILWACFSGGYTHSNVINTNIVLYNVKSKDIASSYPYSMLCKLPSTQFLRCLCSEFMNDPDYGYIAYIKMYGVKSKYYTHYMQVSKCVNSKGIVADNGRVVKCDYVEMWLTSIDMEIILKNYQMHHYEVKQCYKSLLDYLDIRILKFILKLYGNKTKLKGVPEHEAVYKRDKAMLNSCYGMAVTNPLKQSASYKEGWCRSPLTEEFIESKLNDMRKSGSTLMYYGQGLWITALSRRNLIYDVVLHSHDFDCDVVYTDTDSVKYIGDHEEVFQEYNAKIYEHYKELCVRFPELSMDDFMPVDINGNSHPIGMYEDDGEYEEFITMGAKKYAYRENGDLHITVSGVSKDGVSALNNDIRNFKKGFTFDYDHSGKLTHFYNENQPEVDIVDVDGNVYHSSYSYGITLAPTTYTLGITDIYEILVEEYSIKESERRFMKNGK